MNAKNQFSSRKFPFLFGGTFIEASNARASRQKKKDFPSFSEGLSLRPVVDLALNLKVEPFPFLFGGTFIEAGVAVIILYSLGISLPFRRDFH